MSTIFAPGRVWDRERVVVVAGGPSVTLSQVRTIGRARDLDLCKVIAVNDAVFPCWFADILYAADARWWDYHKGLQSFTKVRVSFNNLGRYDVQHMRDTGPVGYDPEPGNIRHGSNSGYQAVHLAAQLGAREIVIVGLDYTDEDRARDHWFGRHEGRLDISSNTADWRQKFRILTDDLARRGVMVSNASPISTIEWVRRIDINDLLKGA